MPSPSLWLIDGSHAVYRAFHAIRTKDPADLLRAPDGTPTNAVHVFTSMILKVLREHRPDLVLVAWDEDAEASRKVIFADYKATRAETPDLLKPQFPLVQEVLAALGVPQLAFRGYEADDIIATLCKRGRAQGMDVVVMSGDKDLLQLVEGAGETGAGVRCYDSMLDKWYAPSDVAEKWGVGPGLVADLLALTGDEIDNVPGVPGVGAKTAAGLLKEFGSLEAVLARAAEVKKPKLRESLLAHLEQVRRGRRLIALFDDLPLPVGLDGLRPEAIDRARVKALFDRLGFHRLLGLLPQPVPVPPSGARRTIEAAPELEAAIARAREAGRIGLLTLTSEGEPLRDQLVGAALSLPARGGDGALSVYLPLGAAAPGAGSSDLFGGPPAAAGLSREKAIALLRPLLEDPAVRKDGHDLKKDVEAWARAGVSLRGLAVDARLAGYLLDPTGKDHALLPAARDRVALELPDLKALSERSGKGKKATPLASLPPAELGDAACALAEGARLLAAAFEEDLRAEPELWTLYAGLELPLLEILAALELRGIALDVAKLRAISGELEVQIDQLLREIHQLAGGEFSPASNPQLAEVLYGKLGLPVLKKGKTGPSTDQEVLEKLAEQHPLPAKILEHRQLTKLKSTYLDALPAALGSDGRLHTTFDQAVAATGRLSSINPNLQNIPIRTPVGARIREAFVPGKGLKLISADYSQIELRILAHISGDPVLQASFASGEDLHARTAGETFGVPPGEVTRQQRDIAKMINYGIAYGLSAFGLAQRLSLPTEEAHAIIERYFARYQGVKAWLDRVVEEAKKDGLVRTLFGRRRFIPDLTSRNPALRMAAERTAVNTPIQGTAADLVKRAMLRVAAALKKEGLRASMLLQIHDELVLEAPPEEVPQAGALVKREMERAADLAVPLVVELGEGDTWAAAH